MTGMLSQLEYPKSAPALTHFDAFPEAPRQDDPPRSPLPLERHWREAQVVDEADCGPVLAARWIDDRRGIWRETAEAPPARYVIALALRSTRTRWTHRQSRIADGIMPAGSVCATAPGEALEAEFEGPCDFVHFYVDAEYAGNLAAAIDPLGDRNIENTVVRDPLGAQLGRSLAGRTVGDRAYSQCVGQMILARLLALRPGPSKTSPLPAWRLRRVQAFIETRISGPISLQDLAAASGLSRMHFAAQFRAATGATPHTYVLQQRIEHAKRNMCGTNRPLVEIALDAGFQNQSHFSTIFKRLTGDTPAHWRRLRHAV